MCVYVFVLGVCVCVCVYVCMCICVCVPYTPLTFRQCGEVLGQQHGEHAVKHLSVQVCIICTGVV
jgi:hypothetical protein